MFREDDFCIRTECVDERLATLARVNVNEHGHHTFTRGKVDNIQAEFLEATKPRRIVSHPSYASPRNDQESRPLFTSTRIKSSDLPLDIFLEIASQVSPLDLIHLAQTSKPLRLLLMSKKSSAIWRDVLGDVPELPPCPSDMSYPLYAALVFGQHCFGCGVGDAFWVDYALRLRLCEQCYGANVIAGSQAFLSVPEHNRDMISNLVLMLVPSVNTFRIAFSAPVPSFDPVNPLSHHMEGFYFKLELEAMLRFFWPIPAAEDIAALRPLVRTRVNYVITRQAHAVLLHAWDNYCFSPAHGEYSFMSIKSSLESPEFSQLRSPDWDESALYSDPAFTAYLKGEDDTPELDPGSDEPKPKPARQLALERRAFERRGHMERAARLRARRAQAAAWHGELLQLPALAHIAPAELPNAFADERMWDAYVLAGDVRDPFDSDPLDPGELARLVARSLANYPGKVMRCLADDLERFEVEPGEGADSTERSAEGGDGKRGRGARHKLDGQRDGAKQNARDVLHRPTALFQCAECGMGALPYPKINAHWQKEHRDKSVWCDLTETAYRAGVWEDGARVAQKILTVLMDKGMAENRRDIRWLDEFITKGCVFCACGDPDMGIPGEGLSWADLVQHVHDHLHDNTLRTKTAVSSMDASTKASTEDDPIWFNDHDLASCIRYLPDGADTTEASNRVIADESTRERIESLLSQCPEKSLPACHLCDVLTPNDRKDDTLFLSPSADAVVYHMRAKHVKDFEEKDIVFWDTAGFDQSLAH